ncbi:MAG: hypothetical protein ACRD1V_08040 [Vicinamibacterales bacterium]
MTCERWWRATSPMPNVAGLSADRKYATAYNAALQAANMAIACAGYRVTAKTGHHKTTFYSANLASSLIDLRTDAGPAKPGWAMQH